jgi:hypothetical protein
VERGDDSDLDAQVEDVAWLDSHEPIVRDRVPDERNEREWQDQLGVRRSLEHDRHEGEVQVVDVLVRDEQPVDALGRERRRRRRDEPELVTSFFSGGANEPDAASRSMSDY